MELVNDNPRVLGNRYEVGELLGRGGMAEVHLGRDARLGRAVAIKLLRTDLARDSTFQARFRREAQSAAALNHPAIVAVYDTGEEQVVESGGGVFNLPYIVMEHIEGRTLRDVLAEGHHLDVDAALDIITGVLTALEYSHRIGIVHRDIKPANVMLTPVGDVKVMDFGIARAMSDASSTMTQTQAVIGTAQYLSPEQARGEQVDTRSDLYSAGCLLYELLTGRPPFVADSPVAVAYQHVREAPIPPSQVIGGLPDSVDRIVLHSLAKGRDERYQTAADFRADVEAARGGRHVTAAIPVLHGSNATTQFVPMQDQTGTRLQSPAGMGPAAFAGQTIAGQGAQDPYADPYNQYNQADPYNQNNQNNQNDDYGRRQQHDQEPPSSSRAMILAGIAVVLVVALVGFFVYNNLAKDQTPGGSGSSTSEAIPDVVKDDAEVAVDKLKTLGFTDITTKNEASSEDEKGNVTKQDPKASATKVALNTPIVLTVGSGVETTEVPGVEGKTRAAAEKALTAANLELGTVTSEKDPKVPKGRVIDQNPSEGDEVEPNSKVDLVISSGAETETVPGDLFGKTEAEARSILTGLGFKVKTQTEPNEAPQGTVFGTDPEAGTTRNQGSTVTIFISAGSGQEETQGPPDPTVTTEPPPQELPSPSVSPSDPGEDDEGDG